jgi:hypothetical protein
MVFRKCRGLGKFMATAANRPGQVFIFFCIIGTYASLKGHDYHNIKKGYQEN